MAKVKTIGMLLLGLLHVLEYIMAFLLKESIVDMMGCFQGRYNHFQQKMLVALFVKVELY